MKFLLVFWALPLGLFWSWYGLSYNDANFGFVFLSRLVHDIVFQIYGELLGIEPAAIPSLIARACLIDTAIVFLVLAYRRRKQIAAWWHGRSRTQDLPTPSA